MIFCNKNKEVFILFTIYQIVELIVGFVFSCLLNIKYSRPEYPRGAIDFDLIMSYFERLVIGVGIQYVIVFFVFYVCVRLGYNFLPKIKIATYISLDMLFFVWIPVFWVFVLGSGSSHISYVNCHLMFAAFVFCSKVLFFSFVDRTCNYVKSSSTCENDRLTRQDKDKKLFTKIDDIENIDYNIYDPLIKDDELLYYDEFNYSVYHTDIGVVISVVFDDDEGMFCRYFILNESDSAMDYDKLSSLADDIRKHTELYEIIEVKR